MEISSNLLLKSENHIPPSSEQNFSKSQLNTSSDQSKLSCLMRFSGIGSFICKYLGSYDLKTLAIVSKVMYKDVLSVSLENLSIKAFNWLSKLSIKEKTSLSDGLREKFKIYSPEKHLLKNLPKNLDEIPEYSHSFMVEIGEKFSNISPVLDYIFSLSSNLKNDIEFCLNRWIVKFSDEDIKRILQVVPEESLRNHLDKLIDHKDWKTIHQITKSSTYLTGYVIEETIHLLDDEDLSNLTFLFPKKLVNENATPFQLKQIYSQSFLEMNNYLNNAPCNTDVILPYKLHRCILDSAFKYSPSRFEHLEKIKSLLLIENDLCATDVEKLLGGLLVPHFLKLSFQEWDIIKIILQNGKGLQRYASHILLAAINENKSEIVDIIAKNKSLNFSKKISEACTLAAKDWNWNIILNNFSKYFSLITKEDLGEILKFAALHDGSEDCLPAVKVLLKNSKSLSSKDARIALSTSLGFFHNSLDFIEAILAKTTLSKEDAIQATIKAVSLKLYEEVDLILKYNTQILIEQFDRILEEAYDNIKMLDCVYKNLTKKHRPSIETGDFIVQCLAEEATDPNEFSKYLEKLEIYDENNNLVGLSSEGLAKINTILQNRNFQTI